MRCSSSTATTILWPFFRDHLREPVPKKDSSILDFLTVGCWNSLTARLISANWPQDENDRTQHPPHILRRMAFLPQPTIIVTRPQYAGLHIQPFWISCSYSDHPLNLCWSCPQVHGLACQQTILQKQCHKVEQMNSAPKILWRTPFMTQCSQLTQAWDQHQSTLLIYLVDWSLLKFIVPLPSPCNHRLPSFHHHFHSYSQHSQTPTCT